VLERTAPSIVLSLVTSNKYKLFGRLLLLSLALACVLNYTCPFYICKGKQPQAVRERLTRRSASTGVNLLFFIPDAWSDLRLVTTFPIVPQTFIKKPASKMGVYSAAEDGALVPCVRLNRNELHCSLTLRIDEKCSQSNYSAARQHVAVECEKQSALFGVAINSSSNAMSL